MMRFSHAPQESEVKKASSSAYSEHQWKELLRRNHILAKEVSKLKSENKELRNQLNSLLLWKLTAAPKLNIPQKSYSECSTQTEEAEKSLVPPPSINVSPPTHSYPSPTQSNQVECSEGKDNKIDIKSDSYFIFSSNQSLQLLSTPVKSTMAVKSLGSKPSTGSNSTTESPVQKRVSQELASRLLDSGSSMFSTPTIERKRSGVDTPTVLGLREPRSTRKPVSYQEPSLKVKVRKGFEFFKFQQNQQEIS